MSSLLQSLQSSHCPHKDRSTEYTHILLSTCSQFQHVSSQQVDWQVRRRAGVAFRPDFCFVFEIVESLEVRVQVNTPWWREDREVSAARSERSDPKCLITQQNKLCAMVSLSNDMFRGTFSLVRWVCQSCYPISNDLYISHHIKKAVPQLYLYYFIVFLYFQVLMLLFNLFFFHLCLYCAI